MPVSEYLRRNFNDVIENVTDLFGFVEYTPLYGGRQFVNPQLSNVDINWMYDNNIGLKLPLSNHYVTKEDYDASAAILRKYHRKGNSITLVNDAAVEWFREDYPLYSIEASVIKDFKTVDAVDEALARYDVVVLHGSWNTDEERLAALMYKDRIRLFANMGCVLNCPSKICYPSFSKLNKKIVGATPLCSQPYIAREVKMTTFDVVNLESMGFTKFKLLLANERGLTGY